jgi:hypothetical protein
MEQTDFEKRVQRTAQLLQWFLEQADITYRGSQIRVNYIAKNIYPTKDDGDHVVSFLCKELRSMKASNPSKFDEIVYGRNKTARELANWWEDHESQMHKEHLSQDKTRRSDDWMRLFNDGAFSYATSPLHLVEMLIEKGYEAPKLSKEIEE